MSIERVNTLISEIKQNLSQTSSSQKDETRVMRAMLNDREYEVQIYGKDGVEGTYCPAKDVRKMLTSVISSTTKISSVEAEELSNGYEFKKADANVMVDLSKEFTNTFLQSGRKLPLGPREHSNVSLSLNQVKATTRSYPYKVGVDQNGDGIFERRTADVKAHESVKVHAPCPSWV